MHLQQLLGYKDTRTKNMKKVDTTLLNKVIEIGNTISTLLLYKLILSSNIPKFGNRYYCLWQCNCMHVTSVLRRINAMQTQIK